MSCEIVMVSIMICKFEEKELIDIFNHVCDAYHKLLKNKGQIPCYFVKLALNYCKNTHLQRILQANPNQVDF